MELDDAAGVIKQRCLAADVEFEVAQVFAGLGVVAGDDFVAAAVVADVFAEGDVDVEGEVAAFGVACAQGSFVVGGGEALVELHGGGVGGVARAGNAVFLDEGFVEVVAHDGVR